MSIGIWIILAAFVIAVVYAWARAFWKQHKAEQDTARREREAEARERYTDEILRTPPRAPVPTAPIRVQTPYVVATGVYDRRVQGGIRSHVPGTNIHGRAKGPAVQHSGSGADASMLPLALALSDTPSADPDTYQETFSGGGGDFGGGGSSGSYDGGSSGSASCSSISSCSSSSSCGGSSGGSD